MFHSTYESEARETANPQCNIGEESVPRNTVDLELICIFKCKGRLADIFDRVALKVELINKKKTWDRCGDLKCFGISPRQPSVMSLANRTVELRFHQ